MAGSTLAVGSELRPDGVAIGDLDSDGIDDVAGSAWGSAGDFVAVFMNSGSADFGTASYFDSGGVEPSAIVIADFDFRLGNDIAATNAGFYDKFGALVGTSNVAVLNYLGGGDFDRPRDREVGAAAEALAAFNIVNTGAKHLITANCDDGTLSVVKNNYVLLASGFEGEDTYPWSDTVPAMP